MIYLEENHDRLKCHTGEELVEINNTFCDIKEVLSNKRNEEDLSLITANMDLLFNMIDKEIERKDAGKSLMYLLFNVVFMERRYFSF